MTLEIKHLVFNNLPEYLAVHGRAAAKRAVDKETSPPVAEQRPLAEQRNGARAAARGAAAEQTADAKMTKSENTENQRMPSTATCGDPVCSTLEPNKADANMQGDEQDCAPEGGGKAADASDPKASAAGNETASPMGAKRKRDEADGNHRDGVQRISTHVT
jgi:hypothetical protein